MSAKILIVDDHSYVRLALKSWLKAKFPHCNILEAASGEEAVRLNRKKAPQIVIIDIKLPGMNGLQATAQIKAATPATKVLILTSYDDHLYRSHAIANGASACLSKGLNLAELERTLTGLLLSEANSNDSNSKYHPGG